MAFNIDNIGKNCYINISEDENIENSLYGTIIGYYKDEDNNEEYYFVSINGNVKRIYDDSLINIIDDSGGGSSVTPASIVSATGQMTAQQQSDTRDNIDADPKKMVVTITYDEDNDTYSANKTFTEISEAIEANKTVIVGFEEESPTYELQSFVSGSEISFVRVTNLNSKICLEKIMVFDDDSVDIPDAIMVGEPNKSTLSSATVTIYPNPDTIYNCTAAALTSLTISNPPSTGEYSIVFTSGSTATTTTIPATILGLEDFAAEANTMYEINVLDNRAVIGSWAVSA